MVEKEKDIVERLHGVDSAWFHFHLTQEAADEIERLREAVEKARSEGFNDGYGAAQEEHELAAN